MQFVRFFVLYFFIFYFETISPATCDATCPMVADPEDDDRRATTCGPGGGVPVVPTIRGKKYCLVICWTVLTKTLHTVAGFGIF